tara:strand:+ start:8057 stop:10258 length:2202 start_codon:yes stop_codon:yes gene_type:complete
MADDKEILISIKVDNEQAQKSIEKQTLKITKLSDANTKLKNKNKELAKSDKDTTAERAKNSEEIAKNTLKMSQANTVRKRAINSQKAEKGTLTDLRNTRARLTEARNKDLIVGTKAFNTANAEINQLSNSIKRAEEGGNDFRGSVGNYSKALDGVGDSVGKVSPALGGMINGFVGATKAALAFIATPIGLVLAGIALAVAAVVQYFQRTEEGGDKLAVGMAFLSGILQALLDVVASLGKLLFDVFVTGFKVVADTFKLQGLVMQEVLLAIDVAWQKVFGSVEDYEKAQTALSENTKEIAKTTKDLKDTVVEGTEALIDNTKEVIKSVAEGDKKVKQTVEQQRAENALNKIRRETTVSSAEANRQIFEGLKLAKDETKSFAERRKGLEEASAGETKLAENRLKIAIQERDIIKNRDAINNSTTEALQEVADAEAKVIEAQTASLRTQTKIQASKITLLKQEEAARNKITNDRIKAEEEEVKRAEDLVVKTTDAEFKLTIAKKEAAAEDITVAEEKAFALTEIEQLRLAKQLEDETLLTADIELLKFESEQRLEVIRENASASQKKTSDNIAANNEKNAKKEIALQKQVANSKMNLINSAFELAKVIGAKDEKVQKALAIAQVIKNTAVGISKAFTLPPPASYIQATAVGVSGAAGILNITNSSSGSGGNSAPLTPSGGGTPQNEVLADTSGADAAASQTAALENAIANLGLTVSVTEINDAQNNVSLSETNSQI